ncbi:lactadherin-like [Dendronephthya gigantea]|uniref:lactadherin-like n=1 Tax=Dendronephthya gigantea TaxID=151771 RepID=UPI001069B1A5|nr:lactadherin-like [Dendronephthya gigantea]XP_028398212.1 lactadherin-like [Dendronephthya gigantea]XP_028398213.1 lactadherin-like [Dendronephthya gigantea]XP_028398214.1 lactadherin-like [Dendronephthya gigantea]XP_028398217.1 lactadherin-like [Dendronephthya gigantea]XP_028398218.1 lactadherin-like [Dendronephthya gigantea]
MVQRHVFVFMFGFCCISLKCGYLFARTIKNKKCNEAVGIQSGDVDDDDITVSSKRKDFNVLDAWCPATINRKQYFDVNLGFKTKITKVSTQGRLGSLDRHVKSYRLYYSMDGHDWKAYKTDGVDKIFKGNQNSYDVSDHILKPAIIANHIRINPTSWKNDICLRVEYYGCDA